MYVWKFCNNIFCKIKVYMVITKKYIFYKMLFSFILKSLLKYLLYRPVPSPGVDQSQSQHIVGPLEGSKEGNQ